MGKQQGGRRRREQPGRLGPRDLLHWALVNDDDPRFPWWLPLPSVASAALWAAYQAVTTGGGAGDFFATLLWPGLAIFGLATLTTFLGWQLDID